MAAIALLFSLVGVFVTQDPKPPARTIDQLIAALGSDSADARESATLELLERGQEATPALKEAAKSDDPEVKARADWVLSCFAWHISRALAQRDRMLAHVMNDGSTEEKRMVLYKMAAEEPAPEDAKAFFEEVEKRESFDQWVRWTARIGVVRTRRSGAWPLPPSNYDGDPLTEDEAKVLATRPTGEEIKRAVQVAAGHARISARLAAFFALNKAAGNECAEVADEKAVTALPAPLLSRVLQSGMKRWGLWWEKNKGKFDDVGELPKTHYAGGLTAEDVWVELMLPGIVKMSPRYDDEGKIIALSDGDAQLSFSYEGATNRLVTFFDKVGTPCNSWNYDVKGRVVKEQYKSNSAVWKANYRNGDLESICDGDGKVVLRIKEAPQAFEYDANGRIIRKPDKND